MQAIDRAALARISEDTHRRLEAERIAMAPVRAAELQAKREAVLRPPGRRDSTKLKAIAAAVAALPDTRHEEHGFRLVLDAITNGAFTADKWLQFRHSLATYPHFVTAAHLLGAKLAGKTPDQFREACKAVSTAILVEAGGDTPATKTYTPAGLQSMLRTGTNTVTKYAKMAGVHKAGRGQKLLYTEADTIRLLDTILDKATNHKLRDRAEISRKSLSNHQIT